jgi:hypothetical protein
MIQRHRPQGSVVPAAINRDSWPDAPAGCRGKAGGAGDDVCAGPARERPVSSMQLIYTLKVTPAAASPHT